MPLLPLGRAAAESLGAHRTRDGARIWKPRTTCEAFGEGGSWGRPRRASADHGGVARAARGAPRLCGARHERRRDEGRRRGHAQRRRQRVARRRHAGRARPAPRGGGGEGRGGGGTRHLVAAAVGGLAPAGERIGGAAADHGAGMRPRADRALTCACATATRLVARGPRAPGVKIAPVRACETIALTAA